MILVTRPQPEAEHTAARLREAGVEPAVCPLTDIVLHPEKVDHWLKDAEPPAALIVTSRNAVRAMQHRAELHPLPLWCVGEETTALARAAGFARAECAGHTAAELCAALAARLPRHGRALYVSGAVVRFDLSAALGADRPIDRLVAYETREAAALPPPIGELFTRRPPPGVLLYSARAAAVFSRLALTIPGFEPADGFFLSEAVYRNADATLWRNIYIPPVPAEYAMMHFVQQWYSALKRDGIHA